MPSSPGSPSSLRKRAPRSPARSPARSSVSKSPKRTSSPRKRATQTKDSTLSRSALVKRTNAITDFKERPSLLATESKQANSYRGLVNVALIVLVLSNLRLVLENLAKYGFLIRFGWRWVPAPKDIDFYHWPNLTLFIGLQGFFHGVWATQVLAAKKALSENQTILCNWMFCFFQLATPVCVSYTYKPNPGGLIIVLLCACTYFFKSVSYAVEQMRERERISQSDDPDAIPNGLSFLTWIHFLLTPSVVFDFDFPRTKKIRRRWLLRRILELVILSAVIVAIVEQYIVPTIHNAMPSMEPPLTPEKVLRVAERVLKLAVPNLYIWLLGFYGFFHLYFNILAELTMMADREFYKDWWNSTSIEVFWRTWNMPIHKWLVKYLYLPLSARGMRRDIATLVIFTVSGIFHEYIISVAFHTAQVHAFLGMMLQVPLSLLTKPLKGTQYGNVIVWGSVMLGQPLAVIFYYRDYVIRTYGSAM